MKDIASRRKTGGLDCSVTVERITVDSEQWTVNNRQRARNHAMNMQSP
jgi:hypothetical protein